MKRDSSVCLQVTVFIGDDESETRDIKRVDNLTETEARAIAHKWQTMPEAPCGEIRKLAPLGDYVVIG